MRKKARLSLIKLVVWSCGALFCINSYQETRIPFEDRGSMGLLRTSLEKTLLFDFSKQMQAQEQFIDKYSIKGASDFYALPIHALYEYRALKKIPDWNGLFYKEFGSFHQNLQDNSLHAFCLKIRQGEVWRLFSPCLLHAGLVHLLFNLFWLWSLGKQVEDRIGSFKTFFILIITGVLANVFQYIVSGPLFVGISGAIMGLFGFICTRSKICPEEDYDMDASVKKGTVIFVLASLGLDLLMSVLNFYFSWNLKWPIANTAHIMGGLSGALLGYSSYFDQRLK